MLRKNITTWIICLSALLLTNASNKSNEVGRRLEILFLGHTAKHHESEKLADIFSKEFFKDGINITYTVNPDDLNEANLNNYDGLILYANYDSISSSQEKSVAEFCEVGQRVYSNTLRFILFSQFTGSGGDDRRAVQNP